MSESWSNFLTVCSVVLLPDSLSSLNKSGNELDLIDYFDNLSLSPFRGIAFEEDVFLSNSYSGGCDPPICLPATRNYSNFSIFV